MFCSVQFFLFYSVLRFCSVLSDLFCSIIFCHNVLCYVLFCSGVLKPQKCGTPGIFGRSITCPKAKHTEVMSGKLRSPDNRIYEYDQQK